MNSQGRPANNGELRFLGVRQGSVEPCFFHMHKLQMDEKSSQVIMQLKYSSGKTKNTQLNKNSEKLYLDYFFARRKKWRSPRSHFPEALFWRHRFHSFGTSVTVCYDRIVTLLTVCRQQEESRCVLLKARQLYILKAGSVQGFPPGLVGAIHRVRKREWIEIIGMKLRKLSMKLAKLLNP